MIALKLPVLFQLNKEWQRSCNNLKEELRSFIAYYTESAARLEAIVGE